jgi:hypothetical protein
MTVLDDSPRRTAYRLRPHRRREIVTTGGLAGVLRIGAALRMCGYRVRDFAADVREGVAYSTVTCTVALADDELPLFAERLREVPEVVAVDPR